MGHQFVVVETLEVETREVEMLEVEVFPDLQDVKVRHLCCCAMGLVLNDVDRSSLQAHCGLERADRCLSCDLLCSVPRLAAQCSGFASSGAVEVKKT